MICAHIILTYIFYHFLFRSYAETCSGVYIAPTQKIPDSGTSSSHQAPIEHCDMKQIEAQVYLSLYQYLPSLDTLSLLHVHRASVNVILSKHTNLIQKLTFSVTQTWLCRRSLRNQSSMLWRFVLVSLLRIYLLPVFFMPLCLINTVTCLASPSLTF